jgi:anti-sigma factor RsiW
MNVIRTGDAGCERICGYFDSYLSNELLVETNHEVLRHLESCPRCAAELEARARLRGRLQTAVRATPVPEGLSARVERALRDKRTRPNLGVYLLAAAAASILCLVVVNQVRTHANPEEAILRKASGRLAAVLNVGLRDHLHCAVFRKYSKQPEPATQMAAQLGPEFAGLAPLIQAKLPANFRILQGHRCQVAGREYVHFIISSGDKLLSLVLTRKQPGESLSGGIYQEGVDRFQVVGFESHDYLVYLISDMDAQQNLQLAANLAPVMRDYLRSMGV